MPFYIKAVGESGIPPGGLDPLSPDVVGSPMDPGYMSDGEYEAISSEDEFIDIEEDLVRFFSTFIVSWNMHGITDFLWLGFFSRL